MPSRRQAIPVEQRYTVKQFWERFPDDAACLEYVMQRRWPGAVAKCVKCSKILKHHRVSGRACYACPNCGNHLFPLAGTIFHKSTTSLKTWFYVVYQMSATRCGVSAKQIQRETGVTYKTAWRMMKQVRRQMGDRVMLKGPIEIDESYWGGEDSNRPQHLRGRTQKTPVLGIVERRGRGQVITRVIPDASKESILPVVRETVQPKAMIYTDGHATYEQLRWMGQSHKHEAVNHAAGEFVRGWAHTNTIEGFWGLVKRGISGVYHQVGVGYLQTYINEYAFRYNRRKVLRPMFTQLLERAPTPVMETARDRRLLALEARN